MSILMGISVSAVGGEQSEKERVDCTDQVVSLAGLSILGDEWSPVMSVSSVLLSIQSMLASQKVSPRRPISTHRQPRAHLPRSPRSKRSDHPTMTAT